MNSKLTSAALAISIIAGISMCNYNNKRFESGIEIQPQGIVDINDDGVQDYLVIGSNSFSVVSPTKASVNHAYVHFHDGKKVSISNEGKYLAHTRGMKLRNTDFNKKTDYKMVINQVTSENPDMINLKVSEITPDFPVTIDHFVSTPKLK